MACFSSDVEVFLQVLPSDKKTDFLENLLKGAESLTTVPTKMLGQSITLFKVRELVGDLFTLPSDGIAPIFHCMILCTPFLVFCAV